MLNVSGVAVEDGWLPPPLQENKSHTALDRAQAKKTGFIIA